MILFLLIFISIIIFYFYLKNKYIIKTELFNTPENNEDLIKELKNNYLITCCLHKYTKPSEWDIDTESHEKTLRDNIKSDIVSSDCKTYIRERWEAIELLHKSCRDANISPEWIRDYNNYIDNKEDELDKIISMHKGSNECPCLLTQDDLNKDTFIETESGFIIDNKCNVMLNKN
jgi:hypothetical protein